MTTSVIHNVSVLPLTHDPFPTFAQSLREIVSGLGDCVAEAMANKRYDEAAEGLTQMNRLTCIDNIVVDRLLEGARNEVKTADSDFTLLTFPTPRTHALLRSRRGLHAT